MLSHTKFQDVYTIVSRCVQWKTPDLVHTCLQEQLTEITLKILVVLPENSTKSQKRKKSRMVIAKFFALNANAKTNMAIARLFLLNVNATNSWSMVGIFLPLKNAFSIEDKALLLNEESFNFVLVRW